jgi:hypothetical protein
MTKIIILCATAQLNAARQKVFYNLAYGYSQVVKTTDSSFQVHIAHTPEDIQKVDFDKDTNVYLYVPGGKTITAEQIKQLVIVADKFSKVGGDITTTANIEIIQ